MLTGLAAFQDIGNVDTEVGPLPLARRLDRAFKLMDVASEALLLTVSAIDRETDLAKKEFAYTVGDQ